MGIKLLNCYDQPMQVRATTRFAAVAAAAGVLCLSIFWLLTGVNRLVHASGEVLFEATNAASPASSADTLDTPDTSRGATARALAEAILRRNIFDSRTGPLSWEVAPVSVPSPAPPVALVDAAPVRCEGDLRLLGSVVNARKPERSLAMFRWQGKSQVVPVGSAFGDTRLLALRSSRAYLQLAGGSVCTLPLHLAASERVSAPAPVATKKKALNKKKPKKPSKSSIASVEMDKGIRSLGSDRFQVAGSLIDQAFSKLAIWAKGSRFVPYSRGGRRVGMRVYGVRPGSLLQRLGVNNGDVLRSVNGIRLSDAGGMLSAYSRLREQPNLSLALYRRGHPRVISYAIK